MSFYRFVTIHACDGRTDRRTDGRTDRILLARPRLYYMQRGKNLQGKEEEHGDDHQRKSHSDGDCDATRV